MYAKMFLCDSYSWYVIFCVPRKMQISGATDLASKGQGASDGSNAKIRGETDESYKPVVKIHCLCGNMLETDQLIQVQYWTCFFFL